MYLLLVTDPSLSTAVPCLFSQILLNDDVIATGISDNIVCLHYVGGVAMCMIIHVICTSVLTLSGELCSTSVRHVSAAYL